MIEENKWYQLKIEEIEKKFAYLLDRVRQAEEEIRKVNSRLDYHATLGDYCPHTGK